MTLKACVYKELTNTIDWTTKIKNSKGELDRTRKNILETATTTNYKELFENNKL